MKASIIIPLWNGKEYIEACLQTVQSQDGPDFEIIVVDNGSVDGSAELVAQQFPTVNLIRQPHNLGFAGGCNVGLQASQGDILILLNHDTVVHREWLSHLVEGLTTYEQAGVVGSKALYPDGRLQHAGGYVDDHGNARHYGPGETDQTQFDQLREVDFVTGASLAISRQAYEAVGGLDETFGLAYYEDVDWCYRVRQAGWRVIYVPHSVLTHHEISADASLASEGMFRFHRNRWRFVLKHWPVNQLNQLAHAEQQWLENLDEGGERLIAAMHRVYLHHLLHLAEVLSWRAEPVSNQDVDLIAQVLLTLRTVMPLKPARIGQKPSPLITDEMASTTDAMETSPSAAEITPESPISPETLDTLHNSWTLKEFEFQSTTPLVGPLIAGFRRQWNNISTRWYVRPIINQQTEFNYQLVAAFDQLNGEVHHLQRQLLDVQNQANQTADRLHQAIQRIDQLQQYVRQQAEQETHDRQRLAEVLTEYMKENGREIGELAQELKQLQHSLTTE